MDHARCQIARLFKHEDQQGRTTDSGAPARANTARHGGQPRPEGSAAPTGHGGLTVPLVLVAMNIVYALSTYPFGKLSDTMRHGTLLAWGLVVLIAADAVLATASGWPALLVGVALWGLHMGMTQGLLAAMVADTAPDDLRGTAFGLFNLVSGVAMLLASVIAGLLWERLGSQATFAAGGAFAVLALLGLIARQRTFTAAGT